MEITRDDQALLLTNLDSFWVELLRQAPLSADPGDSEAARARLFSKPAAGEEHAKLRQDWENFVEPELRRIFQTANQTVEEDLKKIVEPPAAKTSSKKNADMASTGAGYSLKIPIAHLDAWLNTLNQARLALAARYAFSDAELENHRTPTLEDVRDLALLQIHFYGFLQEIFVRELENP